MTSNKAGAEVLRAILRKANEKLLAAKTDLKSLLFDDAVSRAYYAVYHAISAVLADLGLTFSSHAQTLGAFNKDFVKSGHFPKDTFAKIQIASIILKRKQE